MYQKNIFSFTSELSENCFTRQTLALTVIIHHKISYNRKLCVLHEKKKKKICFEQNFWCMYS